MRTAALLLAVALLAACGREQPSPPPAGPGPVRPPAPDAPPPAPFVLTDVTAESGITFVNHTGDPRHKDWLASAMGGGIVAIDHDGDGDLDLLFVDGTPLTREGDRVLDDSARTRLYRNDGGFNFTEVTREAGIDVQAFGFGGASGDYDGDGDEDAYVCAWGRNFLLRNRGDGTFEEVAEAAGVAGDPAEMSTGCAFGDVDGDGVVDLYVANYADQAAQIERARDRGEDGRTCRWRDMLVYCGPPGMNPQVDRLYLGNGDGTFRDVTTTHLLDTVLRYAFQPVMTDLDEDGDLDIYVANDTQANTLWINDGTGRFRDGAVIAAVATNRDVREQAGMGVTVGDANADGRLDLYVTNFSHDYDALYLNHTRPGGVPSFRESTHLAGLAVPTFLRLGWGAGLVDLDLDGDQDLFVACGHVYGDLPKFDTTGTSFRQPCLVLENTGPAGYRFRPVDALMGPALAEARPWRGLVCADLDDDGDVDVVLSSLNGPAKVLRNDTVRQGEFVRFRLVDADGRTDPAGAQVRVHLEDGRILAGEVHHGSSFLGDGDPRVSFGVGLAQRIPVVGVLWPGGGRSEFRSVESGRTYRVTQGGGIEVEGGPR